LLAKLEHQTIKDYELIVIDSSSNDNTVDIAQSHQANIITIAQSEFDHGKTRTIGAKEAKGDTIIYLSQDALPCDEYSVENIIRPFGDDNEIGAVFGRQLPYPNASVFAQHLRLFNYSDISYVHILSDREKYGIKTVFFSDSFSAYRKAALEEIGYFRNGLIFGEDTCAAADMLLKGQKIAYAADAKVFHSHNYTIGQDFRRYFDMGIFHKNQNWLVVEFGKPQGEAVKYIKSQMNFLWKQKKLDLFPEFIFRNAMKFLGYKLGKQYVHLPGSISKRFSMNRYWWD
jgi:rhamnosyltransferase